ncbi:MAG: phosphonopyruvate decarboxylase [Candidatus Binataceae bacterium]
MREAGVYRALRAHGIRFFTGVPDSSLSGFCRSVSTDGAVTHVVAANEGAAVALAAGFHLATGEMPVVYAQNSGLLNALNPFLSLCHDSVYAIPILFVIGWRGEPGEKDEPQHKKTGAITRELLAAMDLALMHLKGVEANWKEALDEHIASAIRGGRSAAILVSKGILDDGGEPAPATSATLSRREALTALLRGFSADDVVYAGIGHTGRELLALRSAAGQSAAADGGDFLCVGAMGYVSQLAIGSLLGGTAKRVWCLDGDGSFLMHMGATAVVRRLADAPLVHVLLDNGVHASVGGQPVCGAPHDYAALAAAIGYGCVRTASTIGEIEEAVRAARSRSGPTFLWLPITGGTTAALPRPAGDFVERKRIFMRRLQDD